MVRAYSGLTEKRKEHGTQNGMNNTTDGRFIKHPEGPRRSSDSAEPKRYTSLVNPGFLVCPAHFISAVKTMPSRIGECFFFWI